MAPSDKKPQKKVISEAFDLAAAAMTARMFESAKPEEVADYCLAVAKRIYDAPMDVEED